MCYQKKEEREREREREREKKKNAKKEKKGFIVVYIYAHVDTKTLLNVFFRSFFKARKSEFSLAKRFGMHGIVCSS